MIIAFYLDNSKLKEIDMNNPELGNPGIGGTQYMIWIISYYLKKYYPELNVVLYANYIDKLPKELILIKVNNIQNAAVEAKKMNVDIFIFRSIDDLIFYNLLEELKLNGIAWAHNFSNRNELRYISECNYIMRYVCVSKQQYNMIIDHKIEKKSIYIYNCINTDLYEKNREKQKKKIVCYVGSIVPQKGFHKLCKVWKKIKIRVPDAELWVIGSGKLYNTENIMGKYGIASEEYEKKFIKYITNNNGELLKDIVFYGVQSGTRKIDIMKNAKVGIVNPTAKSETFCISAIEFESLGVPVVTKKKNGLIDTVKDNFTGILVTKEREIIDKTVLLLNDEKLNFILGKQGIEFVKECFDVHSITNKWYKIIHEIYNETCGIKTVEQDICRESINKFVLLNKRVKGISILKWLPSLYEYKYYVKDIIDIIYKKKAGNQ